MSEEQKEFRIEVWPLKQGHLLQTVRVQKKITRGWFKKRKVWEYVREYHSEGCGKPYEWHSVEDAKKWIDEVLNPPKPEYIKYP